MSNSKNIENTSHILLFRDRLQRRHIHTVIYIWDKYIAVEQYQLGKDCYEEREVDYPEPFKVKIDEISILEHL